MREKRKKERKRERERDSKKNMVEGITSPFNNQLETLNKGKKRKDQTKKARYKKKETHETFFLPEF